MDVTSLSDDQLQQLRKLVKAEIVSRKRRVPPRIHVEQPTLEQMRDKNGICYSFWLVGVATRIYLFESESKPLIEREPELMARLRQRMEPAIDGFSRNTLIEACRQQMMLRV